MTRRTVPLSVIMPVYNAGVFLRPALESIRNQTYSDFECLLCDASTDGSSDFLADFCRLDERFILLRQEKTTLGHVLAQGVEAARADLVARMDADDIALPHRFAVQVARMKREPGLVLLGSAFQYIDANGSLGRISTLPRWSAFPEELLWGCPFSHPSVIFRREAALQAGNYRPFFAGAEDYDLWLRMSAFGKVDNLPDILLRYRMHGRNSVSRYAHAGRRFAVVAQMLHCIDAGREGNVPRTEPTDDIAMLGKMLDPAERLRVLARMLSSSAHLTGDAEDDPEGAAWLEEIQAAPADAALKKALALYHVRCVKRYIRKQPYRASRHFVKACRYNPGIVMSTLGKLAMQQFRRLRQP